MRWLGRKSARLSYMERCMIQNAFVVCSARKRRFPRRKTVLPPMKKPDRAAPRSCGSGRREIPLFEHFQKLRFCLLESPVSPVGMLPVVFAVNAADEPVHGFLVGELFFPFSPVFQPFVVVFHEIGGVEAFPDPRRKLIKRKQAFPGLDIVTRYCEQIVNTLSIVCSCYQVPMCW